MSLVGTSYKRLFLRCVKIDAADKGATLNAHLQAYGTASVRQTKGGVVLTASSGNGQSFGLLPSGGEGLNPVSYGEMVSDMLDRYDIARAMLIESGTAAPNDDQIYSSMMAALVPVTEYSHDLSGLRI